MAGGGGNYNKLVSLRETAGKCSSKEREKRTITW